MSGDTTQKPAPSNPGNWLIYAGLGLQALSLLWWFAFYANYDGAFGLLDLKFACISGATSECEFFRQRMGPTAIPTYYPVLWYAGLAVLAAGFWQNWAARRAAK